jgi:hypothetical protein
MAVPMSSMLAATGLPDPRQKMREDLMRMYGDYILSGPKAAPAAAAPPPAAASSAPGWGEITAAEDEEEEISEDKGQIVEVDEDEEEATAPAQPLDAADEELETAAEEEAEEPVSSADTYESEILKLLEEARGKLLQPKKLSIADILGAGTMRRSAQLIGETEKLNEERQMKAQELALDILMRKSKIEKEREAAQALAKYRQGIVEARRIAAEKGPQDPEVVRVAKLAYPKLPIEQAIKRYLDDRRARPASTAPRTTKSQDLASLRAKVKQGQPLTVMEKEYLQVLEDEIKARESFFNQFMPSIPPK